MTIVALLLAAAATPQQAADRQCDAAPIQSMVGKPASARNKARTKRLSHAQIVREVPVDGVMTMDYSPYRLNIIIGKNGKIAQLNCG